MVRKVSLRKSPIESEEGVGEENGEESYENGRREKKKV